MRTHNCNELRKDHIGQTATIIGWVNTKRDHHGVIFIDIRDREGITQSVFRSEENAEAAKISHGLRQEDIVRVTGIVSERPELEDIIDYVELYKLEKVSICFSNGDYEFVDKSQLKSLKWELEEKHQEIEETVKSEYHYLLTS